jgi:hypothetical protein
MQASLLGQLRQSARRVDTDAQGVWILAVQLNALMSGTDKQ